MPLQIRTISIRTIQVKISEGKEVTSLLTDIYNEEKESIILLSKLAINHHYQNQHKAREEYYCD
jgi:hypothetical protein